MVFHGLVSVQADGCWGAGSCKDRSASSVVHQFGDVVYSLFSEAAEAWQISGEWDGPASMISTMSGKIAGGKATAKIPDGTRLELFDLICRHQLTGFSFRGLQAGFQ